MEFERRLGPRLEAHSGGALLCALGFLALIPAMLWTTALGIELLATAFWLWARAAPDAIVQVSRWSWLRRPASAMWLAVAIHAAFPALHAGGVDRGGTLAMLARLEAAAIMWAGLDLLAALPLARPYSDVPGPLLSIRPWLPVMLPSAGFLVLWKHAAHGFGIPEVRAVAVPLLLLTALLGALRAFARRNWTASLRWLAVTDSAIGALVVALHAAPREAAFLLWLAACGGHAFLLAGELQGAAPRRGVAITRLWRTASWVALLALSWPALLAAGSLRNRQLALLYFVAAAIPVALIAWITVGRMLAAPERRLVVRPNPALGVSQAGALTVLLVAAVGLLTAWWRGFEPPLGDSLVALAPALLGGLGALAARQGHGRRFWDWLRGLGSRTPAMAGSLFRAVTGLERRVIALIDGLVRAAAVPLHDLHAGDAQEYLLFLAGLAVLALTAPLLQ